MDENRKAFLLGSFHDDDDKFVLYSFSFGSQIKSEMGFRLIE